MLPPESDDGHIEYKRYVSFTKYEPQPNLKTNLRFNQLATQMRHRLSEGNGSAIYYLGINDNGSVHNLDYEKKKESLNNIKELVKFIDSKIDNIQYIDGYIKILISEKNEYIKLEEKNILLLGDTESGKTTFLSYLIKNKLDTKTSKARLHILNHKHEIESGKTSSFTYKYIDYNKIKYVFIDSPGLDTKLSKKRNKLLLSFNFDLIIFFDKADSVWDKKLFYIKYLKYKNIPYISINLFTKDSFINMVNPILQNDILKYLELQINNKTQFANIESEALVFSNPSLMDDSHKVNNSLNILFINSYPNEDMGIILSGYINNGYLSIGQELYCYTETSKSIKIIIKSIYKDGIQVDNIYGPCVITILIDYKDKNLLDFKINQIAFLSNKDYIPDTKFRLEWIDNDSKNKLNNLQIMIRNQIINLKREEEYYIINNKNKQLYNINNEIFIYNNIGFGKIICI
jgi:GTPase SAR1 family protein